MDYIHFTFTVVSLFSTIRYLSRCYDRGACEAWQEGLVVWAASVAGEAGGGRKGEGGEGERGDS